MYVWWDNWNNDIICVRDHPQRVSLILLYRYVWSTTFLDVLSPCALDAHRNYGYHKNYHTNDIQWSLYFKTTHWTKKTWSYIMYIADSPKTKFI